MRDDRITLTREQSKWMTSGASAGVKTTSGTTATGKDTTKKKSEHKTTTTNEIRPELQDLTA